MSSMPQGSSEGQPKETSELHPAGQQVLTFLEGVIRLAQKGPSYFLLGLGALIIVLAFLTKLSVLGGHVVDTQPVEFVVMLLVGMVIVLSGTLVGFYTYRSELDVYRDQLRANTNTSGSSTSSSPSVENPPEFRL